MTKWMALLSATLVATAPVTVSASQFETNGVLNRLELHQPTDVENPLEVSIDKGVIVEMIVQCRAPSGKLISGIMIYSKPEQKYCSSKHECFDAFEPAHYDTCR